MSHFTVLVIGDPDTLEDQLAPYMENCCATPDMKYMEFNDAEEEYLQEWEANETQTRVVLADGSDHWQHDRRFLTGPPKSTGPFAQPTFELPVGAQIQEIPLQNIYSNFEEYCKDYHDASARDPEKGRFGYWQTATKYKTNLVDTEGRVYNPSHYGIITEEELQKLQAGEAPAGVSQEPSSKGRPQYLVQRVHENSNADGQVAQEASPGSTWGEVLSRLQNWEDAERVLEFEENAGRQVYILQEVRPRSEQESPATSTSKVVCEGEIQSGSRNLRADVTGVQRQVHDMPPTSTKLEYPEDVSADVACGSLSRDGHGAGSSMPALQSHAGECGGQDRHITISGRVFEKIPVTVCKVLIQGPKWDWYVIGGRWTGFWLMKENPAAPGNVGSPGLMTAPAEEGYADSARKGDIDFAGMRQAAATRAEEEYDLYASHIDINAPHAQWKTVREWVMSEGDFANFDDTRYAYGQVGDINFREAPPTAVETENGEFKSAIDIARHIYHQQPRVKQHKELQQKLREEVSELRDSVIWWDMDSFDMPREEFISRAVDASITTFAIVQDSVWYEKGSMGW
jgi:hypothetical protein